MLCTCCTDSKLECRNTPGRRVDVEIRLISYSEHSTYGELEEFVIDIEEIICTAPSESHGPSKPQDEAMPATTPKSLDIDLPITNEDNTARQSRVSEVRDIEEASNTIAMGRGGDQ